MPGKAIEPSLAWQRSRLKKKAGREQEVFSFLGGRGARLGDQWESKRRQGGCRCTAQDGSVPEDALIISRALRCAGCVASPTHIANGKSVRPPRTAMGKQSAQTWASSWASSWASVCGKQSTLQSQTMSKTRERCFCFKITRTSRIQVSAAPLLLSGSEGSTP